MKIIASNKRALYDYEVLERFEAGLVLSGQEVKSVKTGGMSLKGTFVTFSENMPYLTNAHISPYKHAGELPGYEPTRPRKLLLKKSQIKSLLGKKSAQGLTVVPLRVYQGRRGFLKIEIALARGKKQYDKRATIAEREFKRRKNRIPE